MRQLLTILNALGKHHTPWQPPGVLRAEPGSLDTQDSCSAPTSLRLLAAADARRSADVEAVQMREWIPLLQTLVWPTFIFALLLWRHRDLVEIMTEVKERLKAGAEVEFPGGKLGGKPMPLDEDNLLEIVKSVLRSVLQTELPGERVSNVVQKVEQRIEQEAFLTVDSTPLLGPTVEPWTVPYYRFGTVSALLNDIWATIRKRGHHLPSLSFGSVWVLEVDGRRLTEQDVGIRWAHNQGKEFDDRPLKHPDVAIKPGMQLRVVPV